MERSGRERGTRLAAKTLHSSGSSPLSKSDSSSNLDLFPVLTSSLSDASLPDKRSLLFLHARPMDGAVASPCFSRRHSLEGTSPADRDLQSACRQDDRSAFHATAAHSAKPSESLAAAVQNPAAGRSPSPSPAAGDGEKQMPHAPRGEALSREQEELLQTHQRLREDALRRQTQPRVQALGRGEARQEPEPKFLYVPNTLGFSRVDSSETLTSQGGLPTPSVVLSAAPSLSARAPLYTGAVPGPEPRCQQPPWSETEGPLPRSVASPGVPLGTPHAPLASPLPPAASPLRPLCTQKCTRLIPPPCSPSSYSPCSFSPSLWQANRLGVPVSGVSSAANGSPYTRGGEGAGRQRGARLHPTAGSAAPPVFSGRREGRRGRKKRLWGGRWGEELQAFYEGRESDSDREETEETLGEEVDSRSDAFAGPTRASPSSIVSSLFPTFSERPATATLSPDARVYTHPSVGEQWSQARFAANCSDSRCLQPTVASPRILSDGQMYIPGSGGFRASQFAGPSNVPGAQTVSVASPLALSPSPRQYLPVGASLRVSGSERGRSPGFSGAGRFAATAGPPRRRRQKKKSDASQGLKRSFSESAGAAAANAGAAVVGAIGGFMEGVVDRIIESHSEASRSSSPRTRGASAFSSRAPSERGGAGSSGDESEFSRSLSGGHELDPRFASRLQNPGAATAAAALSGELSLLWPSAAGVPEGPSRVGPSLDCPASAREVPFLGLHAQPSPTFAPSPSLQSEVHSVSPSSLAVGAELAFSRGRPVPPGPPAAGIPLSVEEKGRVLGNITASVVLEQLSFTARSLMHVVSVAPGLAASVAGAAADVVNAVKRGIDGGEAETEEEVRGLMDELARRREETREERDAAQPGDGARFSARESAAPGTEGGASRERLGKNASGERSADLSPNSERPGDEGDRSASPGETPSPTKQRETASPPASELRRAPGASAHSGQSPADKTRRSPNAASRKGASDEGATSNAVAPRETDKALSSAASSPLSPRAEKDAELAAAFRDWASFGSLWDRVVLEECCVEEAQRLKKVFDSFADGPRLSRSGFAKLLAAYPCLPEAHHDFFFRTLARHAEDGILLKDFRAGFYVAQPQVVEDLQRASGRLRIQFIFKAYDLDADGWLDASELAGLLSHLHSAGLHAEDKKIKHDPQKLEQLVKKETEVLLQRFPRFGYSAFLQCVTGGVFNATHRLLRCHVSLPDLVKKEERRRRRAFRARPSEQPRGSPEPPSPLEARQPMTAIVSAAASTFATAAALAQDDPSAPARWLPVLPSQAALAPGAPAVSLGGAQLAKTQWLGAYTGEAPSEKLLRPVTMPEKQVAKKAWYPQVSPQQRHVAEKIVEHVKNCLPFTSRSDLDARLSALLSVDRAFAPASARSGPAPSFLKMPVAEEDIVALCDAVGSLVAAEETVIELDIPLKIFGDLHGHLADLIEFFGSFGWPDEPDKLTDQVEDFLFLGDYVDRGPCSLEVLLLLFSLKVLSPHRVFLLRGNHEDRQMNRTYGFLQELERKLGGAASACVWEKANAVFDLLPLAALVPAAAVVCLHGCLGDSIEKVEDLRAIRRPLDVCAIQVEGPESNPLAPERKVLACLWSDPERPPERAEDVDGPTSPRGAHVVRSSQAFIEAFLERNQLALLVRAHECVAPGYCYDLGGRCLTLFSASNYCGTAKNDGAALHIYREEDCYPERGRRRQHITRHILLVESPERWIPGVSGLPPQARFSPQGLPTPLGSSSGLQAALSVPLKAGEMADSFTDLTRLACEAARSPVGASSFPSSAEAAALLSSALLASSSPPLHGASPSGAPRHLPSPTHLKQTPEGPFGPEPVGAFLASPGPHIDIPSEFLSHSPPCSPLASSGARASAARSGDSVPAGLVRTPSPASRPNNASFASTATSLRGDPGAWGGSPLSPAHLGEGPSRENATWGEAPPPLSPRVSGAAAACALGAQKANLPLSPQFLFQGLADARASMQAPVPTPRTFDPRPLIPIPTLSEAFSEAAVDSGGDRHLPTPRLGADSGRPGRLVARRESEARPAESHEHRGALSPRKRDARSPPRLQEFPPPNREECSPLSPHWRAVHGVLAPTSTPADSRLPEEGHQGSDESSTGPGSPRRLRRLTRCFGVADGDLPAAALPAELSPQSRPPAFCPPSSTLGEDGVRCLRSRSEEARVLDQLSPKGDCSPRGDAETAMASSTPRGPSGPAGRRGPEIGGRRSLPAQGSTWGEEDDPVAAAFAAASRDGRRKNAGRRKSFAG
ncbi:UNVERIFIED_CONTAM: Ser/Thr phosphatase family protein [Hammondia hammondi]|eukprot:XP_008882341.1 Ser/Thr phosphatase family protein [Hammondia hammondi]